MITVEHNEISKLLNNSTVSKSDRKWIKVNGLSSGKYSVNKNLRFKNFNGLKRL